MSNVWFEKIQKKILLKTINKIIGTKNTQNEG